MNVIGQASAESWRGVPFATILAAAATASRTSWTQGGSIVDRFETARQGIALHVATSDELAFRHLVDAGKRAIEEEANADMRHHGDLGNERAVSVYWADHHEHVPAVDRVDERESLAAILPTLPGRHAEALLLVAAHGTIQAAAEAHGCGYEAMRRNLASARRAVVALWWEGYTPPEPPRDRRVDSYRNPGRANDECQRGHDLTAEGALYWQGKGRTQRACRLCILDRARARRAVAA